MGESEVAGVERLTETRARKQGEVVSGRGQRSWVPTGGLGGLRNKSDREKERESKGG